MILLKNFANIFKIPELRRKVFFTLAILVIYRLGLHIPVIGIDVGGLSKIMQGPGLASGLLRYLDLFSGGMLRQCTLFALGVMPYITASIMMQFLSLSFPTLEQLSKEGELGRKQLNQYTRFLALGVSVIQGTTFYTFLANSGLVLAPGVTSYLLFMLIIASGAVLAMWLGEQISLFGIGNGSSMLIFAGVVANLPADIIKTLTEVQQGNLSVFVAIALFALLIILVACIVYLEKGERKIPVQYARRIVGHRVYGGQSTYIPFKINTAGVMPVILATAMLNIPLFLGMFKDKHWIFELLAENMSPMAPFFNVLEFLLIIGFTFFYTALVFNPEELADNIRKSGGFIPGIRPGRRTAEYFNYILTRLGFVGAIYLGLLAVSPNFLKIFFDVQFLVGGTSLLIAVGVALELAAQIEAYLIEHRYEGFLTVGRMKGRS